MRVESPDFPGVSVGNVPVKVANLESVCQWLLGHAVPRREALNVRLVNAYNIALASEDGDYRELLATTGVNFPDGTPVVWFMGRAGDGTRAQRVRGPSLFARALEQSAMLPARHFFLGSTPETLRKLEHKVRSSYPQAVIAGSFSPPFAPIDSVYVSDCAEKIRESSANLVWIGLGTPKQDIVGAALARELDVVCVNVGAAFDFLAGTVREAPLWVQQTGFEWLFRLAMEPKRLWRRYVFGNARFLAAATGHLMETSLRSRTPGAWPRAKRAESGQTRTKSDKI